MKRILSSFVWVALLSAPYFSSVSVSNAQSAREDGCVFHPAYREWLIKNTFYCGPTNGLGIFEPKEDEYDGNEEPAPEPVVQEMKKVVVDSCNGGGSSGRVSCY
ncbi:MAG: hypothetical protein ABJO09_16905 [Hyphomicrobiales bacterium]